MSDKDFLDVAALLAMHALISQPAPIMEEGYAPPPVGEQAVKLAQELLKERNRNCARK